MIAGRLRERVRIERRDAARDAIGGAADSWIEVASVWAGVRPAGGGRIAGEALRGVARWDVLVRPCGVAVGDRVVRGGQVLTVTAVVRDPATPDRIVLETEDRA